MHWEVYCRLDCSFLFFLTLVALSLPYAHVLIHVARSVL
jgi:hypothetical protein